MSLPKDQMNDLHEVLTSSFFKSVKEVLAFFLFVVVVVCIEYICSLWDVVDIEYVLLIAGV